MFTGNPILVFCVQEWGEDMDNRMENVIHEWGGIEVTPIEAYTEIFHLGEHYLQQENEAPGEYKANPIGYWKNRKANGEWEEKGHYRIMFEDTFEEVLGELQRADFSILNGISYFGRKNVQAHASKMFAMIFDLDGVTSETLENFFSGTQKIAGPIYPLPNFISLSGHNVHLYYVFEEPISLYPYTKIQLKDLKYALIDQMWNQCTSTEEVVQHQGINQGFRVFGGHTKIDGALVRVFRINTHPFSLQNLAEFMPEEKEIKQQQLFKESKYTIEEAKKLFPQWYEEVVLQHRPRRLWTVKRALYDWWKRKIEKGIAPGHRYFCIMALAIFAVKCGIDPEELKKDAYALIPVMDAWKRNDGEGFTMQDVDSALECFDPKYATFPRKDLSKITSIRMDASKRNGRPQAIHLKRARLLRDFDHENWREGNGRHNKKDIIQKWRIMNPDGKKIDCHKNTGISRPTIDKWWDFSGNTESM